ncbi:Uu.00g086110.m01.CDS01 [Anthostomella pinea]|uniref:Uu.00g086110.m01.CDS01 n=1 Tax=Anthostomella pinea TaxID=933095 RepID=A0AAI8YJV2_9PEZI|nr:Uu.00g086110.m01.CDS01 [Anthostomella pinea]
MLFLFAAALLNFSLASCTPTTSITPVCTKYKAQIQQQLSSGSTVQCSGNNTRWSEYAAPEPGAIVTVASEDDVAKSVAFASQQNIPFLIQSGANGWADTFTLSGNGFIIDISQLKQITFNADNTQVSFQAGVTNADMVEAAWNNNARAWVATCNCVSVLGATLGGGLGRLQGLYGLGLDQLLSVNYVDGDGNKKTVTKDSDADLWWALKGAGPNFGIVTSVVANAWPIPQADNTAWTGSLIFDESQIEDLISAVNDITLEPEMQMDIYFTGLMVIALPFYLGSEEEGREKFASILAVGPTVDATQVTPYNTWNAAGDAFCLDGGRKPSYTTGLKTMDPTAWRKVWNDYSAFVTDHPEAGNTTVLSECYSTMKVEAIGSFQSSYPFRDVKCYSIAIPWYPDSSLDAEGIAFGQNVRSYWAASAGTDSPANYINFAHGDEPLSNIYGSSLSKLQQLKQKYDPKKRFNQWFPLS